MASVREIRGRIKSVKNTARVTNAMQMVAASKMRRAQEQVVNARPYAEKIQAILSSLISTQSIQNAEEGHYLLSRRAVKNGVIIQITPDRGLAGGLPSNINRATSLFMGNQSFPMSVITVGKKGNDFMVRAGQNITRHFPGFGDRPQMLDCRPITEMISQLYANEEIDSVHLAYTRFVNTLIQEPVVVQLLPIIGASDSEDAIKSSNYEYEPDASTVLTTLLPKFLEAQVFQAILESNASEQSARMVAMRNATDAAEEMVDTLTLELNKARQAMITAELLDLVGGVAALDA
ncbi:MAG: ATP synthase F1 subunit gamma [SAR202 cluster bacterium]|nr:ATP synthase F1 subunit gamma [SAR202 cluster bacterium]